MQVEKEPFVPNLESIIMIENVAHKVIECELESELSSWLQKYLKGQKKRLAFDLDMIQKYFTKDDKILEFGCCPLFLTGSVNNLGYNIQGVDIDPKRLDSAINYLKLNIIKCDFEGEQVPVKNESFDLVIFNEVFEHLRINLIFTMNEVYRILKPGGYLFLSTPNLRSYRGIKKFLFKNKSYAISISLYDEYEKLNRLGHMGHVREYTVGDVTEFLEKIGFKIEKIIYRGIYHNKMEKIIIRLFPSLRPFFTVVAKKDY